MATRPITLPKGMNPRINRYSFVARPLGISYLCEMDLFFENRQNPHRHRTAQLVLVVEGGTTIHIDETELRLTPNTLTVIPAMQMHVALPLEGSEHLKALDLQTCSEPENPFDHHVRSLAGKVHRLPEGTAKSITEPLADAIMTGGPGQTARVMATLWGLLAKLEYPQGESQSQPRFHRSADVRLEYAEHFMLSHMGRGITVKHVAEHVRISPSQLSRIYLRDVGITPTERLRQLRLNTAHSLVRSTSMKINEIAAACGIGSTNTFIRLFKETYGKSPQAFRKQSRDTW